MRADMDSKGRITITPETGAEAFALKQIGEIAFDPGCVGSPTEMPRPASFRSEFLIFKLEVPNGND